MRAFEQKSAVVIGGSGGIGLEISLMLARNGANLTIQGRSEKVPGTALILDVVHDFNWNMCCKKKNNND
mgnify:CR=1 FL=1